MIILKNINIAYDRTLIKEDVIAVPEHCITLIRGESGTGKTSLLYRIGLLSNDTSYQWMIKGKEIHLQNEKEKTDYRKKEISFVLQDCSLFDHYDVSANLSFHAELAEYTVSEEKKRELLNAVHLHIPLHQKTGTLSSGERQRLAFACALCRNTGIIILDEPTSFLDRENEESVWKAIRSVCDTYHTTIIAASHSTAALSYADHILEINDGHLTVIQAAFERKVPALEQCSLSHSSELITCMKYYISAHRKTGIFLTCFLTIIISLILFLRIHTTRSENESIENFEKISENQMLVEGSISNQDYQDLFADCIVYPYFEVKAEENKSLIPVIPLYPQNNVLNQIMQSWGKGDVYLSFQCYRERLKNGDDLQKSQVYLYSENIAEEMKCTAAGVLHPSFTSGYLHPEETVFLLMRYDTLKSFFRQSFNNCDVSSYTVFTNTFQKYEQVYEKCSNKGLQVTLFFPYLGEIHSLRSVSRMVRFVIGISGTSVLLVLFSLLEYIVFRRREKELLLLKLNGVHSRQLFTAIICDLLWQCTIAWLINTLILIHQKYDDYMYLTAVILGILTIHSILILCFLRRVHAETILRDK